MRGLQFFSASLLLATVAVLGADGLQPGEVARLVFRDVDGNEINLTDGHVTIVTVVTRQNEEKAHIVAAQVPDRCVGDPKFHYVTLVNFQDKLPGALHGLTKAIIRQRLDGEAKKLKVDYDAKKIARDPRNDIFVIADFDGSAVTQLQLPVESDEVTVFVFNGRGKLIQRWTDVPPDDSLAKAIAAAE